MTPPLTPQGKKGKRIQFTIGQGEHEFAVVGGGGSMGMATNCGSGIG